MGLIYYLSGEMQSNGLEAHVFAVLFILIGVVAIVGVKE